MSFEQWKKSFDTWEQSTATMMEAWMKSPFVLEPSGFMLSAVMRMKKASDAAMSAWWGAVGLPTRHAQERTLHEIHRLQSQLLDLEEKLAAEQRRRDADASSGATEPNPGTS